MPAWPYIQIASGIIAICTSMTPTPPGWARWLDFLMLVAGALILASGLYYRDLGRR